MRVAAWLAIEVSASILVGAAVATAGDLETFVDLTRALNNIAEKSNERSMPRADPRVLPGFTLVGVVIAGDKRLALVQSAEASSLSPELLPVGGVLAGYRLTDVEEEQVTLVGPHGDRKILRLQTGGGAGRETGAH